MAGFIIFEDKTSTKTASSMSSSSVATLPATPARCFSELPQDIRKRIYKYSLPLFTEVDPSHPEDAAITTEQLKVYFEVFGGLYSTSRLTRAEFRDVLFDHLNVGVNYSRNASQDLSAIRVLGFGAFQTMHIDVHLTDDFPLLALMSILSNTDRLKHLYLTTFTGLSSNVLPTVEEDIEEVMDFLVSRGDLLDVNLRNIKDVHIDFVSEQSVAPFRPFIGAFVQQAWMFRPNDSDSQLTWIIKDFLAKARPTIVLSAASDSQTYSNRGLEEDIF